MGLTGFNRQRKRALMEIVDDSALADKLMAYGIHTPEKLKAADEEDLSFLSSEELAMCKGRKAKKPKKELNKEQSEAEPAEEQTPEEQSDYPIQRGGGWYELSNGESVRGKENADQAQQELNGG